MDEISTIEKLNSEHAEHIRTIALAHKEEMTKLEEIYIKKAVELEKTINELKCDIAKFKSAQIGFEPIGSKGETDMPN